MDPFFSKKDVVVASLGQRRHLYTSQTVWRWLEEN